MYLLPGIISHSFRLVNDLVLCIGKCDYDDIWTSSACEVGCTGTFEPLWCSTTTHLSAYNGRPSAVSPCMPTALAMTQQKNGIRDAPPPFFQPMLVNDSGQISGVCAQWTSSLGGDSLYSTYLCVEDMTRSSSGYLKTLFKHRRAWCRPTQNGLTSTDIAIQPHSTRPPLSLLAVPSTFDSPTATGPWKTGRLDLGG